MYKKQETEENKREKTKVVDATFNAPKKKGRFLASLDLTLTQAFLKRTAIKKRKGKIKEEREKMRKKKMRRRSIMSQGKRKDKVNRLFSFPL